ncbi:MAG: DUF2267 domain-containing protein [Verrucomicrobia bacterium]|nr:DUF2267 domain-containing protein [Verrucomicrobiota bacterium]
MSMTGLPVFDTTIQKTNLWLSELMEDMQWDNRQKAYHALRAVMHQLRDHLPPAEVMHLSSQLPMLVRGFFLEGWRMSAKPTRDHSAESFLAAVAEQFPKDAEVDAEGIVRAVFSLLADHVPGGEIEKIMAVLPKQLRQFWMESNLQT